MIETDPVNIFPYYRLALLYINQEELPKAKEYLLKVSELDPLFNVEKVNWALGNLYLEEKDWNRALSHLRQAYPYMNDKSKCLLDIARCYGKLHDFDKAERSYKKAIECNNKDYLPFYRLGWL